MRVDLRDFIKSWLKIEVHHWTVNRTFGIAGISFFVGSSLLIYRKISMFDGLFQLNIVQMYLKNWDFYNTIKLLIVNNVKFFNPLKKISSPNFFSLKKFTLKDSFGFNRYYNSTAFHFILLTSELMVFII